MQRPGFILIIFLCVAVYYGCEDVQSYSEIPEIKLKSVKLEATRDSMGHQVLLRDLLNNPIKCLVFELDFVDGDGDLFSPSDTSNAKLPISKLHWIYYEKINGEFVQIPDSLLLSPPFHHFPYSDVMEREGQNKVQKGTLMDSIQFNYPMPYDTLEVEFYTVDKAYHQSNIVRTESIKLK